MTPDDSVETTRLSRTDRASIPVVQLSMMLICGLIGGLLVLVGQQFTQPAEQHIASVDIAGIMLREMSALQREGLDETQGKTRTEQFVSNLDRAVQELSAEYNVVLVAGSAVIGGAPDYTQLLSDKLYRSGVVQ